MRHPLIKDISDALKTMEPGAFQEFCLEFLPLFDPSYKGLERHGGTVNGKTRKGTPDLIKTLSSGRQIAVQCSVATDYWKIPKDKSKWKPCADVDKCLQFLSNVQEIILCSNQEIPTNAPNAKAEVLLYAKNLKISLLCCSDVENILIDNIENPNFKALLKNHFSKIYERIDLLKDAEMTKLAIEIFKERPVPLDDALKIAREVTSSIIDLKDAKVYALKKVDELKSRFERESLPAPGSVVRRIPRDFPIIRPIGTIQTLLGVPKIGKTFLVAQCAIYWKSKNINIHWFDCPSNKVETEILVRDISRTIWAFFLPPEKASELADGIITLQSIDFENLRYNLNHPTIYVLDNAEFLCKDVLKSLCTILSKIKSSNLLSQIGFVFVSNKGLKHLCPAISNEISAPIWTRAELKELFSKQLSKSDYYQNDKYLDLLEIKTTGHPLVALALVKKFPSIKKLLLSTLERPSLEDKDLTAEVKTLLFEDILTDTDSLNYVLRLSPLIFKANDKVVYAIKKISPAIAKPFNLILEKLSGTVIEGDDRQGYGVSFIYREVAREKLSKQGQQEIYDVVSRELLTPEDNTINAIEVTQGISYALLANRFERVFFWTTILLQSAVNRHLPKTQIQAIVDRLEIVAYIKPPDDSRLLLMYYTTLLIMATSYSHIENYKKALELLNKIKVPSIKCKDKEIESHLVLLVEATKIYKMLLVAKDNPVESIRILSEIDIDKIKKSLFNDTLSINDFLEHLISMLPIKDIPKNILKDIINSSDTNNEKEIANLIGLALNLGVKAEQERVSVQEVIALLPSSGSIAEILHITIRAQYTLQKEKLKTALKFIRRVIILCQKNHLWFKSVENILRQVQGDIYYKLSKSGKAKTCYLKSIQCLKNNIESFNYAWANYRLGLLSKNPIEAEKYFKKSGFTFNFLGYEDLCARSHGERAVTLVQLDRPLEFVRIAEWMCRRYYLRKKSKFAPAVTIVMTHLLRLSCKLENRSLPNDDKKLYPSFERGVYARVLDIAKPQTGQIIAFENLARAYGLLGNVHRKIKCLHTALSSEAITQLEKGSVFILICELFNEIIPNGDKKEIKELMIRGIFTPTQYPIAKDSISYCIFSKLDSVIANMDDRQKQEFINLLTEIQNTVNNSSQEFQGWWLAGIYLRKANLAENYYHEKSKKYHLWEKAYEYGDKYTNSEVIIQAGHYLSFSYCGYNKRFKDLANIQFNMVKLIPLQNVEFEKFGMNLFNLWRKLDFHRLYESDLKSKQTLMDGAKSLESAGFNPDNAAPIMILLLCSIYEYRGSVVDLAIKKAINIKPSIPQDVQEKIACYAQ